MLLNVQTARTKDKSRPDSVIAELSPLRAKVTILGSFGLP